MGDLSQSEREALAMAERPTAEQEAMVAACDAWSLPVGEHGDPGMVVIGFFRGWAAHREWSRSPEAVERLVTTPHDDPIVAACVENGGHFWPDDTSADEPPTCTRCWFNPGWKRGKPSNGHGRPIIDRPEA